MLTTSLLFSISELAISALPNHKVATAADDLFKLTLWPDSLTLPLPCVIDNWWRSQWGLTKVKVPVPWTVRMYVRASLLLLWSLSVLSLVTYTHGLRSRPRDKGRPMKMRDEGRPRMPRPQRKQRRSEKPNIILMITDDQDTELGKALHVNHFISG